MSYFKHFPKINYGNNSVVNITKRVRVLEEIKKNPLAYLSYFVKDDDTPDNIAYYYYNDPYKVWLVYLANDIIDPYTQWPKKEYDFQEYFKQKYKELSGENGLEILNWGRKTTITDNIVYYENIENPEIRLNKYTYLNDASVNASEWNAVRYYQYEERLNEQKRNIFLIDRKYADRIEKELEEILNG